MAALFSELKIRNLNLKNRIVISPMCQYSARDGFANEWHLVHLGSRAVGGAAMIIFEATAVSPEGRISPDDLGLWNDEHAVYLKTINNFIREQGSTSAVQIAHAGRKASTAAPWSKGPKVLTADSGGWECVAPSAVAFDEGYPIPKEMSDGDMKKVISDFSDAARRSLIAGFDAVELHMAHGYLLHQFLSPISNKRSDSFGGSLENRMRFPLLVAEHVRKAWPTEKPLFVRISATDWLENGWTVDDSVILARKLKDIGYDLIDCSSGGTSLHAKIPVAPDYQVGFAERIRREAGIMTGAVGLITEPTQANEIINRSRADIVLIARESLRDPYWPLHAAKKLNVSLPPPKEYARAFA